MKAFTTLNGVAAILDKANVDTDQIIPKQFLRKIYQQKDEDFVRKRYDITQKYYSDFNGMYEGTNTDANLVAKIQEIKLIENSNIRKGIKNQIEKGSDEIVDELSDRKAMNQNVTLKKHQEIIKNS